jgi:hypothetical protein
MPSTILYICALYKQKIDADKESKEGAPPAHASVGAGGHMPGAPLPGLPRQGQGEGKRYAPPRRPHRRARDGGAPPSGHLGAVPAPFRGGRAAGDGLPGAVHRDPGSRCPADVTGVASARQAVRAPLRPSGYRGKHALKFPRKYPYGLFACGGGGLLFLHHNRLQAEFASLCRPVAAMRI